MHTQKILLIAINVAGGIAVLGSYAWGFLANPTTRNQLWGEVPATLMPLYTASMLAATVGYFLFTTYFLLRVDPRTAQFFGRFGYGIVHVVYLGVLVPSAMWMPLTFAMLDSPGPALWWSIRIVLALVGLSSVLLLAALLALDTPRSAAYWAAVAGLIAFCFQTAVLDAIVWPHHFPLAG